MLKKLYVGRIPPVLEYGMAASFTAAKSNSCKLSRVQHQAMRMMTGAMRSTPISAMETVTGLQPLEDRQEIKVLTQATKFKRLQDHPMHERMNQPTRGRLKRSNFLQHSRILERKNSELLDHMPKPIPSVKTIPSWKRGQLPKMCTKVPGVADRDCQPEPERKSLTLEYVDIKYPEDQWTHAYTDGSAAEATRDGGGGVYIRYNGGTEQITIATGKYSTNFKAEAEALKKAAIEIRNNLPRTKSNVVISTDALSVLSKLQNPHQKDLSEVETALVDLAAQTNLILQWIPAHCGIQEMSKQTGLPGREASWNKRTDIPPILMKRPSSNSSPRKKWKQQHQNYNQSFSLHKLNRTEQVILFRLRTGHNRLNAHMYNKFKVGESEMCPCNADIMTAEHLLQHCRLYDAMGRDTWPDPTLLRDKLYGNLGELRRTAAFVRATGISI